MAGVTEALASTDAGAVQLESRLDQALADCRAALPALGVDARAFFAKVGERVRAASDPAAALGDIAIRDLYLACGCAAGDPAALEEFESSVLSMVPAFVARIDPSPQFAEDVRAEVRDALLLPTAEKAPGIARYSGSGELGAFVRVVATRIGLQLRRRRAGSPRHSMRPAIDPELDYLKLRYRRDFEDAFANALQSLATREKLLLKLHVDGLGIDRIATMYRLHRSTAARRLANIRRKLRERTQRELQQRLSISPTEFESLLAVVRSQMWVSLRAALAHK
jgi:RNA polymerase sigma-70 factor (ECF subfamily)